MKPSEMTDPLRPGLARATEDRATQLRAAYRRRGPVEIRWANNPGQAAIVAERDAGILGMLEFAAEPVRDLLDVGCGDGNVLAALVERLSLRRGVGVDVLPERVERAASANPGLDVRVADATALPFPDQSFDAVVAMTVFSSVPEGIRQLIADEIARVVRPGGVFVWYDMRVASPSNRDVRPFAHAAVATLFPAWQCRSRSVTLVPPIARRLGRATPLAYPLLAAIPILRSHEVGAARRPLERGPDA